MALKVDASFENGVFVPAKRPALADRERVRLTIETARTRAESREPAEATARSTSAREPTDLAIALDFHPDGC